MVTLSLFDCDSLKASPANRRSVHTVFKVLCVLVIAIASVANAQTVDVYVLTGQSNSLGTTGLEGGFANYEPGSNPADASTQFFWSNALSSSTAYPATTYGGGSAGAITNLQMQAGDGGANPSFWGPEFGFARTMYQNPGGDEILIIKASRGGGGNGFWDESRFDANNSSGHMWGHIRDQVDTALGLLTSAETTFDVKGLIYMQGESNNSSEAAIADSRMVGLANSLQNHINLNHSGSAQNMYTVMAEIAASGSNGNRTTTTELQRSLARQDPNFGFVTTADLPLKSDNIHFGRDAKLTYGNRIADAFNARGWVETASRIGGYIADSNPPSATPDPASFEFSLQNGGNGVTVESVLDASGTRAWRLLDGSVSRNPGYFSELDEVDHQRMYDEGWEFRVNAKVASGGGLALWSVTPGSDPGWGVTAAAGNMNGFKLDRVNGDEFQVTLWQDQTVFNLGSGSADNFHALEMRGVANSPSFDFYLDGNLATAGLSLLNGNGFNSTLFQDALFVNSGSTSGTAREVYWNEFSLQVPDASPNLACDSDGDGDCELNDIDAMYAAFGTAGSAFDFDGSGTVGPEDIAGWLTSASDSSNGALSDPGNDVLVSGDIDFNGDVDSTDLGLLLNNFSATGGGWGIGDLDGNNFVDSTDLGLLLNNFGHTSLVAVQVPEPDFSWQLLLAGFLWTPCRQTLRECKHRMRV